MTIEKVVAVFTSRDPALSEPGYAAGREIAGAPGFNELLAETCPQLARALAPVRDLASKRVRSERAAP